MPEKYFPILEGACVHHAAVSNAYEGGPARQLLYSGARVVV